jgi:hypothetical protein
MVGATPREAALRTSPHVAGSCWSVAGLSIGTCNLRAFPLGPFFIAWVGPRQVKAPMTDTAIQAPKSHHLDRRADDLAFIDWGSDDDLLSTAELAKKLGTSTQFLTIGRHRGYGPAFLNISRKCTRYRVGDVRQWLRERTYRSTAEYARRPSDGDGSA